jgi:hypothetical protein
MIIHYEGQAYGLEFGDLTLSQTEVIEKHSGMTIGEWLDTVSEGFDSKSPHFLPFIRAIYWLMLAQNMPDPPRIETVDFKWLKFGEAFQGAQFTEAESAAIASAQAAEQNGDGPVVDPTRPAGNRHERRSQASATRRATTRPATAPAHRTPAGG